MNLIGTTAKASLISNRSMSFRLIPALARAFLAAGPGAFSISSGESPVEATARIRARGFSPWALAYSGEAITTAPAPSTTPDELPAWCTWLILTSG